MLVVILMIALAAVTLTAISLKKCYTNIPTLELKRRARAGDKFADVLFQAATYGPSLQILLWIIIGFASTGFFVMASRTVPAWAALIISLTLIWFGFAWLPKSSSGVITKTLAKYVSPSLAWSLQHLYPILGRLADMFIRRGGISVHSGIYQKDDLLNLLKHQKNQPDNRISSEEIRITSGALTFGDKLVHQVMTPRRVVIAVAATDTIGPHLMDELHASGHSRFPVYQDKPDNFVGILYARDLLGHSGGGQIRGLMKKRVLYVHELQNLNQVLQAFLKTKHHLFLVVNSFEEVVGIISIEDILEQILGKPILDEFDKYDDLRAVAALSARQEHQNQVPEVVDSKPTK